MHAPDSEAVIRLQQLDDLLLALTHIAPVIVGVLTAHERPTPSAGWAYFTATNLTTPALLARQSTIAALLTLLDVMRTHLTSEQRKEIDGTVRLALARLTH